MNTILYFSPTGNVKYIAEKLSNHLGDDITDCKALEFSNPKDLKEQENLIIMFSVHAFNPPRTVRKFVSNIPADLYKNVSLISAETPIFSPKSR